MEMIRDEYRYIQGKLLCSDPKKWNLPRKIIPSDIDIAWDSDGGATPINFMLDNNGKVLLAEFKGDYGNWSNVAWGQRQGYANLVRAGRGNIFAACCCHVTKEPGEYICTADDVKCFQIMRWNNGSVEYDMVRPGDIWVITAKTLLGFPID